MTKSNYGFQNAKNNMSKLLSNAEELDGENSISLSDLFTPEFLKSCSAFTSIDDFSQASGFKPKSQEDFEAIPQREWDEFVQENTTFDNLQDMTITATKLYFQRQLFKGLK